MGGAQGVVTKYLLRICWWVAYEMNRVPQSRINASHISRAFKLQLARSITMHGEKTMNLLSDKVRDSARVSTTLAKYEVPLLTSASTGSEFFYTTTNTQRR